MKLPQALLLCVIVKISFGAGVVKRCFSSWGTVISFGTRQGTWCWVGWTIKSSTTLLTFKLPSTIVVCSSLTAQWIRCSLWAKMANGAWSSRLCYIRWVRDFGSLQTKEPTIARSRDIPAAKLSTIMTFCAILTLIFIFQELHIRESASRTFLWFSCVSRTVVTLWTRSWILTCTRCGWFSITTAEEASFTLPTYSCCIFMSTEFARVTGSTTWNKKLSFYTCLLVCI